MTQQIAWPPSGGIHIHLNLAPPTVTPTMLAPQPTTSAQIERINAWLAANADEFWTDDDTATSIIAVADRLRGQVARLQAMLAAAGADVQLYRINEWIRNNAGDAYDPLSDDGDTADAIIAVVDRLRGECEQRKIAAGQLQSQNVRITQEFQAVQITINQLRTELAAAINERRVADSLLATLADWLADKPVVGDSNVVDLAISLMTSQAAEIKRLNADLAILRSYSTATPHGNGKSQSAAVEAAQAADLPEQYPPAIVAAMKAATDPVLFMPVEQAAEVIAQEAAVEATQAAPAFVKPALNADGDPELSDYIIGLDAGRHTWRTIPKPVRWRLVCSVLRSIWTDGKLPTMDDFDKHAPAWMPTANACATTFGDGKWTVMCGKAIEP